MARGGGVPGTAVALAAAGGVLVWSAIGNRHPVDVIKGVIGKPTSGASLGPSLGDIDSGVRVPAARKTLNSSGATGKAGELVTEARRHLGKPYLFGATGPDKFDCSGLVIYCLKQIGETNVPRFTTVTFGSWAKSRGAVRLNPGQFRAGDIILRTGHMAIASGEGTMIHAPNAATVVKEVDIYSRSTWWGWRLWGAVGTLNEESRYGSDRGETRG